jgi:hypothetical protein
LFFSKEEEENSNSKKVYCNDCIHCHPHVRDGHVCEFKLHKIYDTFYEHVDCVAEIWNARLQNANNNCEYFNVHDELNPIEEDKNV